MACNFTLDKKLILSSSVRMRTESFGKLLVSRGGPTLCLNNAASHIVDLCDGTLTADEIINKIALSINADDKKMLSEKIEKVIYALCNLNILVTN